MPQLVPFYFIKQLYKKFICIFNFLKKKKIISRYIVMPVLTFYLFKLFHNNLPYIFAYLSLLGFYLFSFNWQEFIKELISTYNDGKMMKMGDEMNSNSPESRFIEEFKNKYHFYMMNNNPGGRQGGAGGIGESSSQGAVVDATNNLSYDNTLIDMKSIVRNVDGSTDEVTPVYKNGLLDIILPGPSRLIYIDTCDYDNIKAICEDKAAKNIDDETIRDLMRLDKNNRPLDPKYISLLEAWKTHNGKKNYKMLSERWIRLDLSSFRDFLIYQNLLKVENDSIKWEDALKELKISNQAHNWYWEADRICLRWNEFYSKKYGKDIEIPTQFGILNYLQLRVKYSLPQYPKLWEDKYRDLKYDKSWKGLKNIPENSELSDHPDTLNSYPPFKITECKKNTIVSPIAQMGLEAFAREKNNHLPDSVHGNSSGT